LMAHGVIFTDYNQQGGPRGAGKAESVNMGMLMEQRKWGAGTILFRQMFSAESLTCRTPDSLSFFRRARRTMANNSSIISTGTICLRNWPCFTRCRSRKKSPGNFTADHRLSLPWARPHISTACRFPNCRWLLSATTCRTRRIPAWSGHDRICDRPRQAGSLVVQRPRAE
jgi:hypothetical protein